MIRKISYKLREWRYNLSDRMGLPLHLKGREGEVQIICFHGICEDHHQLINGRFMHLSRYRELLKAMKQHFHILSYADFSERKLHPDKLNILITFDDGYRNFITLALPELKHFAIPVVLFVNDPEKQANWPDLFDITVAYCKDSLALMKKIMPSDAPENFNDWRRWLMVQNTQRIVEITDQFRQILPLRILEKYAVFHSLLSDEELLQVHESGVVTLGNHGANHLHYPAITEAERKADLQKVTDRLSSIGCTAPPFAYPYGVNDLKSVKNLEEWGYTCQFAAENASVPQLWTRLGLHPLFSVGNQLRFIYRGYF